MSAVSPSPPPPPPSSSPRSASAVLPFKKGDIVKVESRMGPGFNKPGGVARVAKVYPDGACDIKYVLGSRGEKRIMASLLEPYISQDACLMVSTPLGKRRRSRRSPAVGSGLTLASASNVDRVLKKSKNRKSSPHREEPRRNPSRRNPSRKNKNEGLRVAPNEKRNSIAKGDTFASSSSTTSSSSSSSSSSAGRSDSFTPKFSVGTQVYRRTGNETHHLLDITEIIRRNRQSGDDMQYMAKYNDAVWHKKYGVFVVRESDLRSRDEDLPRRRRSSQVSPSPAKDKAKGVSKGKVTAKPKPKAKAKPKSKTKAKPKPKAKAQRKSHEHPFTAMPATNYPQKKAPPAPPPPLPFNIFGEVVWKNWGKFGWLDGVIVSDPFDTEIKSQVHKVAVVRWSDDSCTEEKLTDLRKFVHAAHMHKKEPVIEKQKRLVGMINALENSEAARKIKAAWARHPQLETFSSCCISMSESKAIVLAGDAGPDAALSSFSVLSSSAPSAPAKSTNTYNDVAGAKTAQELRTMKKKAAQKEEMLSKARQIAAEAYRNNEWLGDVRILWSQHNRMHCQTGLASLLNDLQDSASCSDDDDDDYASYSRRRTRHSSDGSSSSSSDGSDEDDYDIDDGQYAIANFIRYEAKQHSACEACALSCSDFRELCVSNYPSAPPPEIAEYMFSRLLPACHTRSQRNHVSAALVFALELLPAGLAANCWRPRSWDVISTIFDNITNATNSGSSMDLGNHVEALGIVVGLFEQEQRHLNNTGTDTRNCALTTIGLWLSTAELRTDQESQLPMLQILVNKSICLHHLANTNESGDSSGFLLYRAWDLSRRLVNVATWALLHDVSANPLRVASAPPPAQRKKKHQHINNVRGLRKLQIMLAESFWLGLAPSVSGGVFEPMDHRGHLLMQKNRQGMCQLLSRCREKFAPLMLSYCERRTKESVRKMKKLNFL